MRMERLLKARKKCKMSQDVLSGLLGVSQKTYANWELGKSQIKAESIKKLSELLGVSVSYLLDEDADEQPTAMTSPAKADKAEKLPEATEIASAPMISIEIERGGTKIKLSFPCDTNNEDIGRLFKYINTINTKD